MAYYQQDALSISSRSNLARLIAEMVNRNQAVQESRERLAGLPFFDSLQLFRFLDREQKGFLAQRDFQHIIGTMHRKLLTYAFSLVDCRKVGEISRFQFANFLLPRENLALREANLRSLEESQTDIGQLDTLSIQVIEFQGLLREVMNWEMKLIEMRYLLLKSEDYSLEGVRLALASPERKWICAEDIHKFMKNFGYDITLGQAEALVESIGKEQEGKISFQHLRWVIEGLQGKDKSYLDLIKQCNKKKPIKKPKIQHQKFKKYLSKKKKSDCIPQRQFSSLMKRKKDMEKQERNNQKKLLSLDKKSRESAKKQYQQQLITIQLKREQQMIIRNRERQEQEIQMKLQLELQEMMRKTARLEEESQRIHRLQNRLNIIEDSSLIKKQTHGFVARPSARKRSHLSFALDSQPINMTFRQSVERQKRVERSAIRSHIEASDAYLEYSKQAHLQIMRDRQQKALSFNKENQMRRQINAKTPGVLLCRNKEVRESIDSKFESIKEIINAPIQKEKETRKQCNESE